MPPNVETPQWQRRGSDMHAIAGAIDGTENIADRSDIQAARAWLMGALNLLTVIVNDGLAADALSELEAAAGLIEEALGELEGP